MNVLTQLKEKQNSVDIFKTIMKMPCKEDGKSFFYLSLPFRGIYCWANDIYCDEIATDYDDKFHGLAFNFCVDGGCEVSLYNGNFIYVRPGILSIDTSATKSSHFYPSSRYKGLEIIFDFDELNKNRVDALESIGFNPINFQESLNDVSTHGSFLTIPQENWQRKAEKLYGHLIRMDINIEEIRFYLLELFFIIKKDKGELKAADIGFLSKGQRGIAVEVGEKISADLSAHYTVEGFAEKYGISPSSLKKYFCKLYGMPISMYLHQLRMKESARLIDTGSLSMGEIAEKVGYKNQSKFGIAFKKYFGKSPLEYKRLSALQKK